MKDPQIDTESWKKDRTEKATVIKIEKNKCDVQLSGPGYVMWIFPNQWKGEGRLPQLGQEITLTIDCKGNIVEAT